MFTWHKEFTSELLAYVKKMKILYFLSVFNSKISSLKIPFEEGNGTPLQYSCLENPKDGGAWWAAVHLTERLHFHFSLSCIGEGNGNPLQCSYLENPRDGGAWWAAIYGVAQSRTRLRRLSSSSSSKTLLNAQFTWKHLNSQLKVTTFNLSWVSQWYFNQFSLFLYLTFCFLENCPSEFKIFGGKMVVNMI